MAFLVSIPSVGPWAAILAFFGLLPVLVWVRHRIVDVEIKRAGGVRAPILACDLISGIRLYWQVGKNQYHNQLSTWCSQALDTVSSQGAHFAEFSLTGSKRVLITRDAEQIKTILATKFEDFGHGPQWHKLWRPFLGDGIFAVDGQAWHDSRAMIRPMLSTDRLRNLAIFDACTEKLLSKLPPSGQTIDVKDLFYRLTLDATTDFLLGENVNSLDNPNSKVATAMETAQRIQMFIFVLNPIAPLIPKGEYRRAIKTVENFMEPIIARALAISHAQLEELSKSDEEYSFLHSIVRFSRDPKAIRDQVMSVLLAGRDTTAATLSWAMYELANCPRSWTRLRREVLDVLGATGRPTYGTLKDLQHLRHILNETLRLHPPVTINMRQALRTTTVPGVAGRPDVVLLKGDTITIATMGLHSRDDIYPPTSERFADPAIFSPERWQVWTPKPWTYTPFHGGPRICVGQNFALTEMAFCLARLAQKYERIEYRGDWAAQTLRADIIGTPALDVPLALFEPSS